MSDSNRPNILILNTDQQRADCLKGHSVLRTPQMDRIVDGGVRFTCANTVSPLCMPARASFVSGLYVHNHNMWYNARRLPAEDETYMHHLKRAGYHTAHIGTSHYCNRRGDLRDYEDYMRARGLDFIHETTGPRNLTHCASYLSDYLDERGLLDLYREDYKKRYAYGDFAAWPSPLPEEHFPDAYVGAQSVRFLEQYDRSEPFCLYVGFPGPHEPFDAPGRYATMYDPKDMPTPIAPESIEGIEDPTIRDFMTSIRFSDADMPQLAAVVANYYGKIAIIDDWVGRILDMLARQGLADNTMVILNSDHGEMAGDHQRLYKRVFYESSVVAPLVIAWPGRVAAGMECAALVEHIDVFPTLLEAAGCEPSERCMGRSLMHVMENPTRAHRDQVHSEVAWEIDSGRFARTTMIRTERYKYAVDDLGRVYMLYDLENDPNEQRNLAADPDLEPVRAEMRERMTQFLLFTQYTQHRAGARRK